MAEYRSVAIILILCLITIFLIVQAVSAQDSLFDRLVLAQIHILPGSDWDRVAEVIERIKAAGFNGVIFRAFHNRGDRYHELVGIEPDQGSAGVYFETKLAPTIADMLGPLSQICRDRDMKLFAWMTTRTMDWVDMPAALDRQFDEKTGNVVTSTRFDLFNSDFKMYLLGILADIARIRVDGIILQDDFTIKTREGFTPVAISLFEQKSGLNLIPASMFEIVRTTSGKIYIRPRGTLFREWAVFKADYLAGFGAEIVAACKAVDPELQIGWNVYHDTALSPEDGLNWLSQDWSAVENAPFDLTLFMAYHRQAAAERGMSVTEAIAALEPKAAELAKRLGDRLVLKLQMRDWQTGLLLPMAEVNALARAFSHLGANIALVPVGGSEEELNRFSPLLRNAGAGKNGTN